MKAIIFLLLVLGCYSCTGTYYRNIDGFCCDRDGYCIYCDYEYPGCRTCEQRSDTYVYCITCYDGYYPDYEYEWWGYCSANYLISGVALLIALITLL